MTTSRTTNAVIVTALLLTAVVRIDHVTALQPFLIPIIAVNPSVTTEADGLLFAAAVLMEAAATTGTSPGTTAQLLPLRLPNITNIFDDDDNGEHKADYYIYDYDTQPITNRIVLTREEQEIFHLISMVRNLYTPTTTIRVAGGWVRDKLLQIPSKDLDFVLDNVSGKEFCELLEQHLLLLRQFQENEQEISFSTASSSKSTVSDNTIASSHLQTANVRVNGLDLDFARFRLESYQKDSRIPQNVKNACAVQDAWRRDLTINSLFYNINTNQVEDWTEQGLNDLRAGQINTPLAPLPTLIQDPLRALRAIRFAAQFSFTLSPKLFKAAQDPRVQQILPRKVSNDRIGKEVDSIFGTRDPSRGVRLLIDTNLLGAVFRVDEATPLLSSLQDGFRILAQTQALARRIFVKPREWDATKRRFLWYAAFLQPIYSNNCDNDASSSNHIAPSRKNRSIIYQLLTRTLKRPSSDSQAIEQILRGANQIQEDFVAKRLLHVAEDGINTSTNDVAQNDRREQKDSIEDLRWMCYQRLKSAGAFWKESLLLATLLGYTDNPDVDSVERQYRQAVSAILNDLGLTKIARESFALRPLMNGSEIRALLPGISGPDFRQVMLAQEEWQVRHCTDGCRSTLKLKELSRYLRESFPELSSKRAPKVR